MSIPADDKYECALFNSVCMTTWESTFFGVCDFGCAHFFVLWRNVKMPDYEKMYFGLLNKTERVVKVLTEYQREIADMYAEAILEESEEKTEQTAE